MIFGGLELRLSGPVGQSFGVVSSSLRIWARDLLTATPPTPVGFGNRGPNVVILLLDCFRADYLEGAAPRLAQLAAESWHYERYFAAASWTKPSSASLFTGLLPRRHGITRGEGYQLPQEAMTLAELLKAQGLVTAGFVQGVHLTRVQQFDQGFQHYVDRGGHGSKHLLGQFFSWLEAARPPRFFAYLHFPGTHDSYYYDNDFLALLRAPAYRSRVDFAKIDYKFAVGEGKLQLSDDEVTHLRAVARAKAQRVDRQAVGEFLDRFARTELPQNTLLIITSDHGDGLNEHGFVSHGFTVYNEEIHSPLVIHYPETFAAERGFAPRGRAHCPASTVDLMPTILDFIGGNSPSGLDGASLVPQKTPPVDCPRPVFSEMAGGGRISAAAIIQDPYKLIAFYEQPPRFELFDLAQDFAETHDLAVANPEQAARLGAALEHRLNADGTSLATWSVDASVPISEELRQQMRTLGYVD